MIELNSNKEIIRIEAWEDIVSRPGFRSKIKPSEHSLKEIIGRYYFPKSEEIHCGLPCNTAHQKGYLVVTKDGLETNIGHICGQKHFGVIFKDLAKSFDREMTRKDRRERISVFASDLSDKQARFALLKEVSLGPIYRNSRALVKHGKGVPDAVVKFFRSAEKTLSGDINLPRIATEREHEILEAESGRDIQHPHYVDEVIGVISGVELFRPSLDVRENTLAVGELLDGIGDCNIVVESDAWLRETVKQISEYDTRVASIKKAVREACKLLNKENLAPLKAIVTDSADRKMFSKFVKKLPQNYEEACEEYDREVELA